MFKILSSDVTTQFISTYHGLAHSIKHSWHFSYSVCYSTICAVRSSSLLTGINKIFYVVLQEKVKRCQIRWSRRTRPTLTNPPVTELAVKWFRGAKTKCAGATSCWNHISCRTVRNTTSKSSGNLLTGKLNNSDRWALAEEYKARLNVRGHAYP